MHVPIGRGAIAAALLAALGGPPEADASTRLAGNVWVVDEQDGLVTIVDAGRKITFSFGPDTIIRRGSTDRAIGDLRRGDCVVVTLAEETPDELRARLIAIAGPPAVRRGGALSFDKMP
jgi:hypothetical protein